MNFESALPWASEQWQTWRGMALVLVVIASFIVYSKFDKLADTFKSILGKRIERRNTENDSLRALIHEAVEREMAATVAGFERQIAMKDDSIAEKNDVISELRQEVQVCESSRRETDIRLARIEERQRLSEQREQDQNSIILSKDAEIKSLSDRVDALNGALSMVGASA